MGKKLRLTGGGHINNEDFIQHTLQGGDYLGRVKRQIQEENFSNNTKKILSMSEKEKQRRKEEERKAQEKDKNLKDSKQKSGFFSAILGATLENVVNLGVGYYPGLKGSDYYVDPKTGAIRERNLIVNSKEATEKDLAESIKKQAQLIKNLQETPGGKLSYLAGKTVRNFNKGSLGLVEGVGNLVFNILEDTKLSAQSEEYGIEDIGTLAGNAIRKSLYEIPKYMAEKALDYVVDEDEKDTSDWKKRLDNSNKRIESLDKSTAEHLAKKQRIKDQIKKDWESRSIDNFIDKIAKWVGTSHFSDIMESENSYVKKALDTGNAVFKSADDFQTVAENQAMNLLGREKKTLTNKVDETFDNTEKEFKNGKFALERIDPNAEDSNSPNYYNTQVLVQDEDGNAVLDAEGKPMYKAKYNSAERLANTDLSALVDFFYLSQNVAPTVGELGSFAVGGFGAAKGLSLVGKGIGKVGGRVAMRQAGKIFPKHINIVERLNKSVNTAMQSYLTTDLESQGIAKDVEEQVKSELLDKYSGLEGKGKMELMERVMKRNNITDPNDPLLQGLMDVERAKIHRALEKENPELAKNVHNTAKQAGALTRATNNLATITNLREAAMFLRAKKFSRSGKLGKPGWSILKDLGSQSLQEAIEEGGFNAYAEKAGYNYGMGRNYTLGDFFEKDFRTAENAESMFLGAALGFGQSAVINTVTGNYATTIREYQEQQKQLKEIKALNSTDVDKSIKALYDAGISMNNHRNNSIIQDMLEASGESDAAQELSEVAMLHRIYNAAKTGLSTELENHLEYLANSPEITPEERSSIYKMIEFSNVASQAYDTHFQAPNRKRIMSNRMSKKFVEDKRSYFENLLEQVQKDYEEEIRLEAEYYVDANESFGDSLEERNKRAERVREVQEEFKESKRNSDLDSAIVLNDVEEAIARMDIENSNIDKDYRKITSRDYQRKLKEAQKKRAQEEKKGIFRRFLQKPESTTKEEIESAITEVKEDDTDSETKKKILAEAEAAKKKKEAEEAAKKALEGETEDSTTTPPDTPQEGQKEQGEQESNLSSPDVQTPPEVPGEVEGSPSSSEAFPDEGTDPAPPKEMFNEEPNLTPPDADSQTDEDLSDPDGADPIPPVDTFGVFNPETGIVENEGDVMPNTPDPLDAPLESSLGDDIPDLPMNLGTKKVSLFELAKKKPNMEVSPESKVGKTFKKSEKAFTSDDTDLSAPDLAAAQQIFEKDDNLDLLMNPHTGRPEMPTQEEYDEAIEEYRQAFVEKNGREPVFEDLMQTVVQEMGVDNGIKLYKSISTAWINTAPEGKKEEAKKQVEDFHKKYFGVRKAEQKVLGLGRREVSVVQGSGEGVSVVSSSKVEPTPQEEQEIRNEALEKETDTVGGFDPSLTEEDLEEGGKGTSSPSPFPGQGEVNGLPKSPFYKVYNGMKIATRIFKAAFNSIAYKEVFEGDGSITFKSVERFPKLKTEGNPHLMDILDPDLLVPGVEVKITVAENPQDIPITIYEEQPLTGYIVAKKMTFGEWQALDPENRKEGTIEYLETVPMTVTANIDGKEISFGNIIHTVNWWNRSKVAPSNDEYGIDQDRLIAENQDLTRAMRERVINGETSFVVDERIYSVTQKVEDKGDVDAEGIPAHMLRLSVNNPDATIAFLSPGDDASSTDFVVNKGIKGREEYFEGEVVNKEAILNNLRKGDFHGFGKYFRMSRIGTTVKDGKVVPLYQAIEVVDNLDQKALSKAAKDFLMIDRAIKWHNGILEGEISAEQKKKFENIIKSLEKLELPTYMESQNGHRFTRFSQMYKEFYPVETSKGSKEYKLVKNFFGINNKKFYVLDSEGNVVNYKSPYGKKAEGYKAFLMDNSFDNNLEFKITNHKGEEKYIADVQPKISFKPAKQVSNPVTTETKPNVEERQADYETSTTVTENTSKKVEITPDKPKEEVKVTEEKKVSKKEENIGNTESAQEGGQSQESGEKKEGEEKTKTPKKITLTQDNRMKIRNYIFHRILNTISENPDLTSKDIYGVLEQAMDVYFTDMKENYPEEYEEMLAEKDKILGLGVYLNQPGTVSRQLSSFLNISVEEKLENEVEDGESEFEKNYSKASYEESLASKLSIKIKMLLAGIPKTSKNHTNTEFGGLPEFEDPNIIFTLLQEMLSDTDNTIDSLVRNLKAKKNIDPERFAFIDDLIGKLQSAEPSTQRRILFRLNQTKVNMDFIMIDIRNTFDGFENTTSFKIQRYNANSRNPKIKIRQEYTNNFKQSSLIENNGMTYKINEEKAEEILEKYEEFNSNPKKDNISEKELKEWLSNFGIEVEESTLKTFKRINNGNISFKKSFIKNKGIFGVLANNLKEALELQRSNPDVNFNFNDTTKISIDTGEKDFDGTPITKTKEIKNLLLENTGNYLTSLINLESQHRLHSSASMHIAGKTVNEFAMTNFAKERLNEVLSAIYRGEGEEYDNLIKDNLIKDNFLFQILSHNPQLLEQFGITTASLSVLKDKKNNKVLEDGKITDLGLKDHIIAVLGFLGQDSGNISGIEEHPSLPGNLKYRFAKMLFPTLSDSSESFLANVPVIDFKGNNLKYDGSGNVIGFSDSVLKVLRQNLFQGEANRIIDYVLARKQDPNFELEAQGHNLGSQMFLAYPGLNTVHITNEDGSKLTLLDFIHAIAKEANSKEEALEKVEEKFKEGIDNFFTDLLTSNIKEYLTINPDNTVSGKWSEAGLVSGSPIQNLDGTEGISIKTEFIDSKYISGKEGQSQAENIMAVLADFILNSHLTNNSIHAMFAGDLANYVNKENSLSNLFQKDENGRPMVDAVKLDDVDPNLSKEEVEDLIIASKEKVFNKINTIMANNLSKRLKGQISPGNRIANSKDKTYKQVFLNDAESSSSTIGDLISLFYDDASSDKSRKQIERIKALEKEINDLYSKEEISTYDILQIEELSKELAQEKKVLGKAFPLVAPYLDITGTDAQEYTTWREHLNVILNKGEEVSEKESEALDIVYDKLVDQEKNGVNESNKLSPEELKMVFQPVKPLYSGMHYDNLGPDSRISRYMYVKTSSFPLLPQMTAGTKLDNLRKNLESYEAETGQYIRASYQSGNKVGANTKGVNINTLMSREYGEEMKNILDTSSTTMYRKNFSISQDKPFKADKNAKMGKRNEIRVGKQFELALLSNGISHIEENIFPSGAFSSTMLSILPEELKPDENGMLSGKALAYLYNDIYKNQQSLLRERIYEEFNTPDGFWSDSVSTVEAVQKVLISGLDSQQDIDALQILYQARVGFDENGSPIFREVTKEELNSNPSFSAVSARFRIPIWLSPNTNKFESVLNAIVKNRLIKTKLPGWSSPVASSAGFEFSDTLDGIDKSKVVYFPDYDGKELKATHKKEDGSLSVAEVLVPAKFQHKVDTGKKDERGNIIYKTEYIDFNDPKYHTVDPETGVKRLNMEMIDEDLLTHFSYRIPTSSHQSGTMIKVVGFLPHEAGDIMVVPKEHTTQIGEDYDIDIRNVYNFNTFVDESGKIKKFTFEDIPVDSKLENVKEEYKAFKAQLKEEIFNNIDEKWKNNADLIAEIIALEEELATLLQSKNNRNSRMAHIDTTQWEEDLRYRIEEKYRNILSAEEASYAVGQGESIKRQMKGIERNARKSAQEELRMWVGLLKEGFQQSKKEAYQEHKEFLRKVIGNKKNRAAKLAAYENSLIDVYKAVFSSYEPIVRRKIALALNTDLSGKTADIIENKLASGKVARHFSVMNPSHQQEVLVLGAAGKLGIGVHSNWVTFNALLQQQGGITLSHNPITLGGFTSDGRLGNIKTIKKNIQPGQRVPPTREIVQVNMENQNVATDNQKLQIMGRRNENSYTINVLALMGNLGFDIDYLQDSETEVHYPSLFISQPIIREYVRRMQLNNSITNKSVKTENEVIEEMLKELANEEIIKTDEKGRYVSDVTPDTLSGQLLYDNLTSHYKSATQASVLLAFQELNKLAEVASEMKGIINPEEGISHFNTINKKEKLIEYAIDQIWNNTEPDKWDSEVLSVPAIASRVGKRMQTSYPEFVRAETATKLIGDFKILSPSSEMAEELERLDKEGYLIFNRDKDGSVFLVKPNNFASHKMVSSLSTAYSLWDNIFPYEHSGIGEVIDTIMSVSNFSRNPNSKKALEMKYKILSDMRDYIYSHDNGGLYQEGSLEDRKRLFLNEEGEGMESLAGYLNRLKKLPQMKSLFEQPFFRNLELLPGGTGEIGIIKFSISNRDALTKEEIYQYLETLYEMTSTPLPIPFKGKNYTYSNLITDLARYSMLGSQEGGAIGFRNYIPVRILEDTGFAKLLRAFDPTNRVSSQSTYNMVFSGHMGLLIDTLGLGKGKPSSAYVGEYDISNLAPKDRSRVIKLVENIRKNFHNSPVEMVGDQKVKINFVNDGINMNQFVRQFFQHNPEYAKVFARNFSAFEKGVKSFESRGGKKDLQSVTSFEISDKKLKEYDGEPPLLFSFPFQGQISLFAYNGKGRYNLVPQLGTFGVNEYRAMKEAQTIVKTNNIDEETGKTIEEEEVVKTKKSEDNSAETKFSNFFERNTTEDAIRKTLESNPNLLPIYTMVKELGVMNNLKIKIFSSTEGPSAFYSNEGTGRVAFVDGPLEPNTIYLNSSLLAEKSQEWIQSVVAEELLHSVTKPYLDKYLKGYQYDSVTKESNMAIPEDAPPAVIGILQTYKEAFETYITNFAKENNMSKEEAQGIVDAMRRPKERIQLARKYPTLYRFLNIDEFIAGVLTDKDFRTEMSKISYKASKETILDKFSKHLAKILESLSNAIGMDSTLASEGITASVKLLEEISKGPGKEKGNTTPTSKKPYAKGSNVEALELLKKAKTEMDNNLSSPDKNVKVQRYKGKVTPSLLQGLKKQNPDTLFVFDDFLTDNSKNDNLRMENTLGIPFKKDSGRGKSSFFTDEEFKQGKENVDKFFNEIEKLFGEGKIKSVQFPEKGIGGESANFKKYSPKLNEYISDKIRELEANLSKKDVDISLNPFDGKDIESFIDSHFDKNGRLVNPIKVRKNNKLC